MPGDRENVHLHPCQMGGINERETERRGRLRMPKWSPGRLGGTRTGLSTHPKLPHPPPMHGKEKNWIPNLSPLLFLFLFSSIDCLQREKERECKKFLSLGRRLRRTAHPLPSLPTAYPPPETGTKMPKWRRSMSAQSLQWKGGLEKRRENW